MTAYLSQTVYGEGAQRDGEDGPASRVQGDGGTKPLGLVGARGGGWVGARWGAATQSAKKKKKKAHGNFFFFFFEGIYFQENFI